MQLGVNDPPSGRSSAHFTMCLWPFARTGAHFTSVFAHLRELVLILPRVCGHLRAVAVEAVPAVAARLRVNLKAVGIVSHVVNVAMSAGGGAD